jgi:hypothetical protein
MKPTYQKNLTLNEEDAELLEACQKEGYTIVGIFRDGLNKVARDIQRGADHERKGKS